MRKKLLFILSIIALTSTSTTFTSNRKESKRQKPRRESPKPSCRQCGIWRVCFSCCCNPQTIDVALSILDIVHAAIEVVLLGTPGAIREVYLLCQNAGYALSKIAISILNEHGFLDDTGNLKKGWRDHILQLLAHDGTAENPKVFYFEQSIEDLTTRYPDVVRQLREASSAHNVYVPEMITTLLYNQYRLIKTPSVITIEELDAIAGACNTASTTGIHRISMGPSSRFRLRPVSEVESSHVLENSLIID